jgi:hypothetical protein
VLRIGLLFCALAVCACVTALWTHALPRNVHANVHAMGFGFPETFSSDDAQTDALRLALAKWTNRDLEAREKRR